MILQIPGDGIGQTAAGADCARNQTRCAQSADHTALPDVHHGIRRDIQNLLHVDHAAHIEQKDHLREGLADRTQHADLFRSQIVRALARRVILLLTCGTTDQHDRRVGILTRCLGNLF